MRHLKVFIVLLAIILWSSCRKDFDTVISSGGLEFSTDTIQFDTLFTRIKSSTMELKVFNKSDDDISIPEIYLERGNNSKYRLNVDGLTPSENTINGTILSSFTDITIQAKDSIFVFAELLVDLETDAIDGDSSYDDKILFNSLNGTQEVVLTSYISDATFIVQFEDKTIRSFDTDIREDDGSGDFVQVEGYNLLADELTFTNERPYVIYGNAIVPSGESLTIEPGARIHFHEDSGLIVESGASVQINGTQSPEDNPTLNEVIIQGDRFGLLLDDESDDAAEDNDIYFSNFPGQWNFIWIMEGSSNNTITNTTIKNSSIGLLVEGNGSETEPNLTLRNVQIYNSQAVGIQANASNITAENLVISESGRASLNIEEGGTYDFNHCTLVNFASFEFSSLGAVSISNSLTLESTVSNTDLNASFTNCIIAGRNTTELSINNDETAIFNFNFTNCLIDLSDTFSTPDIPELDSTNEDFYTNCIFNGDPNFGSTEFNNLRISEDSDANGEALTTGNTIDITGKERDIENPDIGAYESVIFDEETEE